MKTLRREIRRILNETELWSKGRPRVLTGQRARGIKISECPIRLISYINSEGDIFYESFGDASSGSQIMFLNSTEGPDDAMTNKDYEGVSGNRWYGKNVKVIHQGDDLYDIIGWIKKVYPKVNVIGIDA